MKRGAGPVWFPAGTVLLVPLTGTVELSPGTVLSVPLTGMVELFPGTVLLVPLTGAVLLPTGWVVLVAGGPVGALESIHSHPVIAIQEPESTKTEHVSCP